MARLCGSQLSRSITKSHQFDQKRSSSDSWHATSHSNQVNNYDDYMDHVANPSQASILLKSNLSVPALHFSSGSAAVQEAGGDNLPVYQEHDRHDNVRSSYSRSSTRSVHSHSSRHSAESSPPPSAPSPLPYLHSPNSRGVHKEEPSRLSLKDFTSASPPAGGRYYSSSASARHVEIDGNLVPIDYVKDSLETALRRHDSYRRALSRGSSGGQKKSRKSLWDKASRKSSGGGLEMGEIGFDDSFSSTIDMGSRQALKAENSSNNSLNRYQSSSQDLHSSSLRQQKQWITNSVAATNGIDTSSEANSMYRSLMSTTYKNKIASIINIENDYAAKWMKMKEKRDERYNREMRKLARKEVQHTFRRIVFNTEK